MRKLTDSALLFIWREGRVWEITQWTKGQHQVANKLIQAENIQNDQ